MTIRIKNWDKFQHYRNRRPPWIRLYRDLLDDPDFDEIAGDEAKTLVKLWLAVSEFSTDGELPDIKRLALRMHIASTLLAQQITKLNHWFDCDADTLLAYCKQVAIPESESESEGDQIRSEGETEREQIRAQARDDSFDIFWERYDIKTNKAEAITVWKRVPKADRLEIMMWLERRIAVEQQSYSEGWFCPRRPNPAAFLRKKRWKDSIPSPPPEFMRQHETKAQAMLRRTHEAGEEYVNEE